MLILGEKKKRRRIINIPSAKTILFIRAYVSSRHGTNSSGSKFSWREHGGINKFDQRISLDPIHDFERRREGKGKNGERGGKGIGEGKKERKWKGDNRIRVSRGTRVHWLTIRPIRAHWKDFHDTLKWNLVRLEKYESVSPIPPASSSPFSFSSVNFHPSSIFRLRLSLTYELIKDSNSNWKRDENTF